MKTHTFQEREFLSPPGYPAGGGWAGSLAGLLGIIHGHLSLEEVFNCPPGESVVSEEGVHSSLSRGWTPGRL